MVVADTAGRTTTGILGLPTLLLSSSYIKYKTNKTSSNSRCLGEVENRSRSLRLNDFHINPSCESSLTSSAETRVSDGRFSDFDPVSHSFHKHSTARRQEKRSKAWKN